MRINIVSGQDNLAAYGDSEGDQAHRYARTREFMRLVRRLWTEEKVSFAGEHFQVTDSTVVPRIRPRGERLHPRFYFGGASEAAERVAVTEADVQLFWGEPLDGVRERIDRLKSLSRDLDRDLPPLEFGLRITTLVRDTTDEAWADAEAKVAEMAKNAGKSWNEHRRGIAVGQQRLLSLAERGDVLDDNLYTAPGKIRRRRGGHHLAGRLGGGCRPVAAQIPGTRHHTFRAVRHTLPAGNQTAGIAAAAAGAGLEPGSAIGRRLKMPSLLPAGEKGTSGPHCIP